MAAAVSILYSESADIWLSSVGSNGAGLRSLYIAYRHADIPIQILTEDDCANGRLFHTDMLVVTVPNVAARAATAIAAWVRKGGTLLSTASGGLLDEYNRTSVTMEALLGVKQSGVRTGTQDKWNWTVDLIKQDLRFVDVLDTITLTAAAEIHRSGTVRTRGSLPAVQRCFFLGIHRELVPALTPARLSQHATYLLLAPRLTYASVSRSCRASMAKRVARSRSPVKA